MKRLFIMLLFVLIFVGCSEKSKNSISLNSDWETIIGEGKSTEINFYMWSGDSQINRYVDEWVAGKMKGKYDIKVNRIPIVDIKDTINKLAVEKKAKKKNGSIDLIWINGENFKIAKKNKLLWGDFSSKLPNIKKYVNNKTLDYDFGEPIEGLEVPWGEAQFVFVNDSEKLKSPPKSASQLMEWVKKNPGKFTYPAPPDFTGSAFIRHIVYETAGGYKNFLKDFDKEEASMKLEKTWEYLNEIEPYLWRNGETYPESQAKLHQLYANGEIYMTMGYHPKTAENKIAEGLFTESSRSYLWDNGTLFNNHYLSIPFNAKNKAGTMLLIDFLISLEAQAVKADPKYWGDGTVLDMRKLSKDEKIFFTSLKESSASVSKEELASKRVPELKAEYVDFIEKEWEKNVSRK